MSAARMCLAVCESRDSGAIGGPALHSVLPLGMSGTEIPCVLLWGAYTTAAVHAIILKEKPENRHSHNHTSCIRLFRLSPLSPSVWVMCDQHRIPYVFCLKSDSYPSLVCGRVGVSRGWFELFTCRRRARNPPGLRIMCEFTCQSQK